MALNQTGEQQALPYEMKFDSYNYMKSQSLLPPVPNAEIMPSAADIFAAIFHL